jgi:tight adherence protein B
MNPAFLTGLLALCATTLLIPPRGRGLHRLTPPTPHPDNPSSHPTRLPLRRGSPHLTRLWPLIPTAALLALFLGLQILVSTIAIGVIVALIAVQRAQHQRRTSTTARRTQVIEALDVLAADLTAGRPPIDALEGAASVSPDFHIAHAAAKLGGDIPGALDLAAESPGAGGLRALAAAWRVSEESGAAFATLTDRLAESLRADETIHRQTEASLAGARSTARILAALPVFGIALGYSLGASPLTFLTTTPAGYLCLASGLALTAAGLHWTTHLSKPPI